MPSSTGRIVTTVRAELRAALSTGHPPDLATLRAAPARGACPGAQPTSTPLELGRLVTRLGDEALADLIAELDAFDAARLLGKLGPAQAADVLEEMDPDDAADVVGRAAPHEAEAILVEMEHEEAQDVRELLAYPPESAGRHHDARLRGRRAVPDGRRGARRSLAAWPKRPRRSTTSTSPTRRPASCSACSRCATWCSRRAGSWSRS